MTTNPDVIQILFWEIIIVTAAVIFYFNIREPVDKWVKLISLSSDRLYYTELYSLGVITLEEYIRLTKEND